MEKITDNRHALARIKMQGGFQIATQSSPTSDYIKLAQFKRKLNNQKDWLIDELFKIYHKDAEKAFQGFEDVILNGNDLSIAMIDKCEKSDSILKEIVRKYENRR